VEGDVAGGAVATDERVGRVLAGVDDVPEQVALRILCPGAPEVLADAPEGERTVVVAPALHRQSAQQQEAAPAVERARPGAQARADRG